MRSYDKNALFQNNSNGDAIEFTSNNKIKSGNCYLEMGPLKGKDGVGSIKQRVARWNCDITNSNRGHQFTFRPVPVKCHTSYKKYGSTMKQIGSSSEGGTNYKFIK